MVLPRWPHVRRAASVNSRASSCPPGLPSARSPRESRDISKGAWWEINKQKCNIFLCRQDYIGAGWLSLIKTLIYYIWEEYNLATRLKANKTPMKGPSASVSPKPPCATAGRSGR